MAESGADEAAILQDLREASARMNDALRRAHDANLDAEIKVEEIRVVGRRARLSTVIGRATRARVELDERF